MSLIKNKQILIDCKGLGWVDAQLGTAILTIVSHSRMNGNEVSFQDMPSQPLTILQKNKTLVGQVRDTYNTAIPVTPFRLDSEVDFAKFARVHLSRQEMPKMSSDLREKFFEGIDELFANCSLHSNSPFPVFVGGQFFPVAKRLTFTISDGGQGIDGSLRAAGRFFATHEAAIDWAMQPNNSARTGDIPGGLGLAILKEFIKMNGGRLTICSNGGYWEMRGENVTKSPIRHVFPGTVATVEINTSDVRSYQLDAPVNANDIW